MASVRPWNEFSMAIISPFPVNFRASLTVLSFASALLYRRMLYFIEIY